MKYTVKQLARLAGVSVRTLHYYDQIGLLKPAEIGSNGYRMYKEAELLRLQQILFFKELEFSLEYIREIMDAPNFDISIALGDQRKMLELKRRRLTGLMKTIDKTLQKINHKTTMKDQELYDGFSDEQMKAYAEEARQRWGHTEAYKQSQERAAKLTKEDWERIKKEGDDLLKSMVAKMNLGPEHAEIQELVNMHYNALRTFYEPNLEMYSGLADMYVNDQRFRAFYDRIHPDLVDFLHKAMKVYCENGGRK